MEIEKVLKYKVIPSHGGGDFDGVEETNNGRKEDVEVVVQVGAEKLNGAQKLRNKTKSSFTS